MKLCILNAVFNNTFLKYVFFISRKLNIHLAFIPRKLTWLLQPCDTHVFRRYKSWLNNRMRNVLLQESVSQPSLLLVLQTMIEVVQKVVDLRDWSHAFDANGFHVDRPKVSPRVVQCLDTDYNQHMVAAWPTADELEAILPRKKNAIVAELIAKSLSGEMVKAATATQVKGHTKRRIFPIHRLRRAKNLNRTATASVAGRMFHPGRQPIGHRLFKRKHQRKTMVETTTPGSQEDWKRRLRPRKPTQHTVTAAAASGSSTARGSSSSSSLLCPWSTPKMPPAPPPLRKRNRAATPLPHPKQIAYRSWTIG